MTAQCLWEDWLCLNWGGREILSVGLKSIYHPVCVCVSNRRPADKVGDAIPAVRRRKEVNTHKHTHTEKHKPEARESRWALSQAAKQITSRYDICRQADRGGRSVPAGTEQQLTAPAPGMSSPSPRDIAREWLKVRDTTETGISTVRCVLMQTAL